VAVALVIAANVVLWPYELRTRAGFRRAAAAKLTELHPTVVAVAGSYGKTTTKRLVAHALDRHGDTLPTPKSFNTLLGLTTTVNNELTPQHRVFVAEMDAYNPGEIAAMCDLVRPSVSVLTAVGPQHLERFGSMDRILDALLEVASGTTEEGTVIVYAGGDHGAAAIERARRFGRKVVTYAAEDDAAEADVIARKVKVSGDGTTFHFDWPGHAALDVTVSLLGRHQALNATAALIVAACLDRDLAAVAARFADAPEVEHRLQVVPTNNGVIVIDDSYNANPVGVHNALEVLQEMQVNKRIVVTPGIVELGSHEYDENVRYGEHAAHVCDDLIVVEARTAAALIAGAEKGGLDATRLHRVKTLDEATATIGRIATAGDVVLFANDLPDTY
jgi:UDP-N-acetylmuramoyl-tripeptide--D-alanyl-D-alanine ligase